MKVGLLTSPSDVCDAYVSAFIEARYVHNNSIESCAPIIKKIKEWALRCDGGFPADGVYGCLGLYRITDYTATLYQTNDDLESHNEMFDELNRLVEPLREQIFYKTLNKTAVMCSFGVVVDRFLLALCHEAVFLVLGHEVDDSCNVAVLSDDGDIEADLELLPNTKFLFGDVVLFHKIYPALDFSSIIQARYYEFVENQKRLCWSFPYCSFPFFSDQLYHGKSVWGVWLNAIMKKMGYDAAIDETELRGYSSSSSEPQLTMEEKVKYAQEIKDVCHQVPYL